MIESGLPMILNEVTVDEYYTIDLPDHDRHKQVVRVVHDSYVLGKVINRELCIVEDENNCRFIIKKIRLREERDDVIELLHENGATCPDCDGRNTLHLEDKTHECHDCGETYDCTSYENEGMQEGVMFE